MSSQIGSRLVFENAKSFIQSQGFDASQAVLTQSYIRSEVDLSATVTNYHVPVLINDQTNGAAFNTERRVQLQDIHVVSSIGIFVASPGSSTATAFPLLTYPAIGTTIRGFSAANAAALYSLYNGSLNIQVNNQNVLPNWDVYRHYFVPQTQNGVGVTAQTVFPIDQNDGSEFGFVPMEPNLLLNGAANINANITLPGAVATVTASSRIVVIFRTILAQNVTSVR
jgi:hypothetical protein